MSVARRTGLAVVSTVLTHGMLFVGAFTFVPPPLDIDIEIEFDMLEVDLVDPDMIQGNDPNAKPPEPEAPPPEPEPEPTQPEPEPPSEPESKDEPPVPPEEEGPKRDLGKRRSKVSKLGPPNANYHILLSTRNIRKLDFAEQAMKTIEPLPDFRYLVDKGGFDPLKDFDHVLIASSNLRSVTQTFLAVDHRISTEAVKAKIEDAVEASNETIEWTDHDGILSGNPVPADGSKDTDPRHFVLLKKKVAVLVRPEFLAAVVGDEVGEEKTAANFVSELTKLRRYSRRIPTAGLQFMAHDVLASVKRKSAGGFELPNDVEFTMEAQPDPEFHLRLKFSSIVAAKQFVSWWNVGFRKFIDGNLTAKIMLGSVIGDIEVSRSRAEVRLWGELEKSQIELILTSAASVVEREQARYRKRRKKKKKAQEESGESATPPSG